MRWRRCTYIDCVDLIDKPDDDTLAAEVDSEMDTLAEEHPIYEEQ